MTPGIDPNQILLQQILGQAQAPQASAMPGPSNLNQRDSGPAIRPQDFGGQAPPPSMIPNHPNLSNFLSSLIESFNAKVNPHYFQQMQESARQKATLDSQWQMHHENQDLQEREFKAHQEQLKAQQEAAAEASSNQQRQQALTNLASGITMPGGAQTFQTPSPEGLPPNIFNPTQGPTPPNQFTSGGILQAPVSPGYLTPGEVNIPKEALPPELQPFAGDTGLQIPKSQLPAFAGMIEKGAQAKAMQEGAKTEFQNTVDFIDQNVKNPLTAGALKNELKVAMIKVGANNGNTSEFFQAAKDIRKKILEPLEADEKAKADLSKKLIEQKALLPGEISKAAAIKAADLDAEDRHIQSQINPEEIQHITDEVKRDNRNIKNPLYFPSGKRGEAIKRLVDQKLASEGTSVSVISGQLGDAADFARVNLPHVQEIKSEIQKVGDKGLGPLVGRINEFTTGKIGEGDKDFQKLSSNVKLLRSAMARIHGGARGAASPFMVDYFSKMLDAGKMTPELLKTGVETVEDWMNGYAGGVASPKRAETPEEKRKRLLGQ